MKKIICTLMLFGIAGLLVSASAQPAPEDTNTNAASADQTPPPDAQPMPDDNGPPMPPDMMMPGAGADTGTEPSREPVGITPSRNPQFGAGQASPFQSGFMPPATAVGTNVNDLNMNFKSAPLEMVLNYLADAAGFIIVEEARINNSATVTVNGKHMTRNEAVDLLNSVLNKNNLGVIRDGRTLTVVDKAGIGSREIPVKTGNVPDAIPKNAEVVTQIIPVRFVEARGLLSELSSFVSSQATVDANADGNSIIITDTQANIHHLAEIIQAIDNSAEAETIIKVFRLTNASPADVSSELSSLFPSSSSGGGFQTPTRFAGGRGGGGGGRGGGFGGGAGGPGNFFAAMLGGGATGNTTADRIQKAMSVTVVPDSRIQAVVVTAPKNMMDEIEEIVRSLDVKSDRDQDVYTFKVNNGDPQQLAQVLQGMFQTTQSRTTSSGNQNSMLQQRTQTAQTTSSQQMNSSSFGSSGGGTGGRSSTGF